MFGGGGYISGCMRIQFTHTYEDIISVDNLLDAWREFLRGKKGRSDVQEFEKYLMHHILSLHADLAMGIYRHGGYYHFTVTDPKPRDIHKATVRDRLLHHALYRQLYPFFDRTFISDSYSCRKEKGTHRAMDTFRRYSYMEGKNGTRTVWVLKCDIRKFFASIDQQELLKIFGTYIPDKRIIALIENIIRSFDSGVAGRGLPLGNLTSQLLVNVYMNEFDQFAKHTLKAKRYMRYADDFVFLSRDRAWLELLLPRISTFLNDRLALTLHPDKVSIGTLASGVDFLGWVHFTDHRVPRTTTKKRMFRSMSGGEYNEARLVSYLGMLSHGNTHKLRTGVQNMRSSREE